MFKKTLPLVGVILFLWAATLAMNFFWRQATSPACVTPSGAPTKDTLWPNPAFPFTFSLFAIGLLSFVSFLGVSRDLRGRRGTFQDGDVRLALTCTFVTVFLALLSFYSFTLDEPTAFSRVFFDSFLNITVIIVGFYFATTGAIELVKVWQEGKARDRKAVPTDTSADTHK